jgi:hypothetical protein
MVDNNGFTCGEELYVFNLVELTWRRIQLSGDIPVPCYHHSICIIPDTAFIVLFGGIDSSGTVFNHLVLINSNDGYCRNIEHSNETGIYGHCSFIEKGSDENQWRFYVIGGCSNYEDQNSSFYFDDVLQRCSIVQVEFNDLVHDMSVQYHPAFSSVVVTDDRIMIYGGTCNKQKKPTILTEFAQNIPDEIAMIVLSFLDRKELCSMRIVSKNWRVSQVSEYNMFWESIYHSVIRDNLYSLLTKEISLDNSSVTGYKHAVRDLRAAYYQNIRNLIDARKQALLPEPKTPLEYSNVSHQYIGKSKLQDLFQNVNKKKNMNKKFKNAGMYVDPNFTIPDDIK